MLFILLVNLLIAIFYIILYFILHRSRENLDEKKAKELVTFCRKFIFIYTLNPKRSKRPLEKHFSMINIVEYTKLVSWILKKEKEKNWVYFEIMKIS